MSEAPPEDIVSHSGSDNHKQKSIFSRNKEINSHLSKKMLPCRG